MTTTAGGSVSTMPETRADAWKRREALRGRLDFTMMYVGHDAFCRDVDRLLAAAECGAILTPEARGTWELFSRMLHVHHTAEDVSLWPRLETAVSDPLDLATLEAMKLEHASLDPLLNAITVAFADGRGDDISRDLDLLSRGLRAHMRHEEDAALPLLERTLGQPGWVAFGEQMRRRLGMRDMSRMLPWLLDEASESSASTVLGMVPTPVRVLNRHLWSACYRRTQILH
jgi:hypothetical protein